MKFECTVEQLLAGVSLAVRFTQKQASLPVLSALLLTADSGAVVVRATNLECGVEVQVPAKVVEGGTVAVPSGVLVGFLSNTRDKSVGVSDGEVLRMKTDHATASVKLLAHDEFPTLPRISAERSFTIKGSDLARALRSVIHCAAVSSVKPELQSVFISGSGGKLTTAATDSFRLAEKTVPLKSRDTVPPILIPARNAAEFLRIIESVSGDVVVYFDDHQISAQVGPVYYTSRLLEGTFPNYQQIIPKDFTTEAVVLREDLLQALRGLSVFSDKFMQVSFSVKPKEKTVELSSRNADVGEEVYTLRATASGEEVSLNFNSRYLADSLAPVSGESVRLSANGPGKAMVVRDAGDDSFLYLAMPMNR